MFSGSMNLGKRALH